MVREVLEVVVTALDVVEEVVVAAGAELVVVTVGLEVVVDGLAAVGLEQEETAATASRPPAPASTA
jgi:hypothetical protein